jgi:hypothetical protein
MKKLLMFSLVLAALFIILSSTTASGCDIPWYWRFYCNWSGCCSDNSCCGWRAVRIGGAGGCGSRCETENGQTLEEVYCTPVSAGCPSGSGPGDHPHRTPDAP